MSKPNLLTYSELTVLSCTAVRAPGGGHPTAQATPHDSGATPATAHACNATRRVTAVLWSALSALRQGTRPQPQRPRPPRARTEPATRPRTRRVVGRTLILHRDGLIFWNAIRIYIMHLEFQLPSLVSRRSLFRIMLRVVETSHAPNNKREREQNRSHLSLSYECIRLARLITSGPTTDYKAGSTHVSKQAHVTAFSDHCTKGGLGHILCRRAV